MYKQWFVSNCSNVQNDIHVVCWLVIVDLHVRVCDGLDLCSLLVLAQVELFSFAVDGAQIQ